MPPYSHTDQLATNDDGTVIELEGKQIDSDVEEDILAEDTQVKSEADSTAAITATRVGNHAESDSSRAPNTTVTQGIRARRKRVQSMPVGSHGAQQFFVAPASGIAKLDEIRESVLSQGSSSSFPVVKSKSTEALGKLCESLAKHDSVEESPFTSSAEAGKVSMPAHDLPECTDTAKTSTLPVKPAASSPDGLAERTSMEHTATCQCIIL